MNNFLVFFLGFNWEPEPRVGEVGSLVDFEINKCLQMHSYYAQDMIIFYALDLGFVYNKFEIST